MSNSDKIHRGNSVSGAKQSTTGKENSVMSLSNKDNRRWWVDVPKYSKETRTGGTVGTQVNVAETMQLLLSKSNEAQYQKPFWMTLVQFGNSASYNKIFRKIKEIHEFDSSIEYTRGDEMKKLSELRRLCNAYLDEHPGTRETEVGNNRKALVSEIAHEAMLLEEQLYNMEIAKAFGATDKANREAAEKKIQEDRQRKEEEERIVNSIREEQKRKEKEEEDRIAKEKVDKEIQDAVTNKLAYDEIRKQERWQKRMMAREEKHKRTQKEANERIRLRKEEEERKRKEEEEERKRKEETAYRARVGRLRDAESLQDENVRNNVWARFKRNVNNQYGIGGETEFDEALREKHAAAIKRTPNIANLMQAPARPQPTEQRTDYSEIFSKAQNLRSKPIVTYDSYVRNQLVAKAVLEVKDALKSSGSTEYGTLFRLLLAKALQNAMIQLELIKREGKSRIQPVPFTQQQPLPNSGVPVPVPVSPSNILNVPVPQSSNSLKPIHPQPITNLQMHVNIQPLQFQAVFTNTSNVPVIQSSNSSKPINPQPITNLPMPVNIQPLRQSSSSAKPTNPPMVSNIKPLITLTTAQQTKALDLLRNQDLLKGSDIHTAKNLRRWLVVTALRNARRTSKTLQMPNDEKLYELLASGELFDAVSLRRFFKKHHWPSSVNFFDTRSLIDTSDLLSAQALCQTEDFVRLFKKYKGQDLHTYEDIDDESFVKATQQRWENCPEMKKIRGQLAREATNEYRRILGTWSRLGRNYGNFLKDFVNFFARYCQHISPIDSMVSGLIRIFYDYWTGKGADEEEQQKIFELVMDIVKIFNKKLSPQVIVDYIIWASKNGALRFRLSNNEFIRSGDIINQEYLNEFFRDSGFYQEHVGIVHMCRALDERYGEMVTNGRVSQEEASIYGLHIIMRELIYSQCKQYKYNISGNLMKNIWKEFKERFKSNLDIDWSMKTLLQKYESMVEESSDPNDEELFKFIEHCWDMLSEYGQNQCSDDKQLINFWDLNKWILAYTPMRAMVRYTVLKLSGDAKKELNGRFQRLYEDIISNQDPKDVNELFELTEKCIRYSVMCASIVGNRLPWSDLYGVRHAAPNDSDPLKYLFRHLENYLQNIPPIFNRARARMIVEDFVTNCEHGIAEIRQCSPITFSSTCQIVRGNPLETLHSYTDGWRYKFGHSHTCDGTEESCALCAIDQLVKLDFREGTSHCIEKLESLIKDGYNEQVLYLLETLRDGGRMYACSKITIHPEQAQQFIRFCKNQLKVKQAIDTRYAELRQEIIAGLIKFKAFGTVPEFLKKPGSEELITEEEARENIMWVFCISANEIGGLDSENASEAFKKHKKLIRKGVIF